MRLMKQCAAAVAAVALGACSLDLKNPNAPVQEEVTTSVSGVIGIATGLQARYAQSYGNFAYMSGLVNDEFASVSAALISISDAEQGTVAPGTAIADNVFNSVYRTVRAADDLLAGAEALESEFDAGTHSGLRALAFALKADALGQALQSYQQLPIDTYDDEQPTYVARSVALARIRVLLDSAQDEIAATPPSALFNTQILTPGVNLSNMIQLFRARYARIANDWPTTLAASNLVGRTGAAAFSQLTFPAPSVNFFSNVTGGANGIAPRRQFRTSMAAGDGRAAYFVAASTTTGRVGALLDAWNPLGYANRNAPMPVYYPDEALLLKAEALVNLGSAAQLTEAQAVIDSVRTDCGAARGIADPKPCLAALGAPLTAAQLLTEIYLQRRFELYGTGLRWEDSRRRANITGLTAAPAVPSGGQRCWLPYALGDRNANPNVPADATEPAASPASPASCPTT
jgi:hypothetical protein